MMIFSLYISSDDPQTICFQYPRFFNTNSILQIIRLEIGALAAWSPAYTKSIKSYVSSIYPNIFDNTSFNVIAAAPERTFWEKVTILHHEANRPESSIMPSRYSRHYYDLYCISHSDNKLIAMKNINLLKEVVKFKMKFYPRNWAHYEQALPGTIKLLPPNYRMEELEKDYINMQEMIYGNSPSFKELMEYIKYLELEINSKQN